MLSWLDEFLIPLITSMYEAVGYLGVAIAMAVDASSFPVPSEFILPFAGFLVADPTAVEPLTGGRWLLIPTIAAATLGGLVGTWGAYAIGAYGGRPLLNRFGRIVRIDPADLDRADAFFARHGGKIVFWSRFIPLLRTAISFPAGIARMPLGRFLLYSAVGSLVWNAALIGGGAAWALFSSLGRPIVAAVGARNAVTLSAGLAIPLMVPFVVAELALGGIDLAAATTPSTLLAVLYLGVGATSIGWSCWYRGYAAAPPRLSAGVLFLQPLVAAALGVGLLSEALDGGLALGALFLLGGVAMISFERSSSTKQSRVRS